MSSIAFNIRPLVGAAKTTLTIDSSEIATPWELHLKIAEVLNLDHELFQEYIKGVKVLSLRNAFVPLSEFMARMRERDPKTPDNQLLDIHYALRL